MEIESDIEIRRKLLKLKLNAPRKLREKGICSEYPLFFLVSFKDVLDLDSFYYTQDGLKFKGIPIIEKEDNTEPEIVCHNPSQDCLNILNDFKSQIDTLIKNVKEKILRAESISIVKDLEEINLSINTAICESDLVNNFVSIQKYNEGEL